MNLLNVGVLVSKDLIQATAPVVEVQEYQDELDKLQQAMAEQGMRLQAIPWKQAAEDVGRFDVLLPLFVWDYFDGNQNLFLSEMRNWEASTTLLNPGDVIKWNSDKSYLRDLASRGVPCVETAELDSVDREQVEDLFRELDCEQVVIKPRVGGGSWRQILYSLGDPWPGANQLPPDVALVQPYLKSIEIEGELSFLYFGGAFSHALVKTPQAGDYRIQARFGGIEAAYQPTENELQTADRILAALEFEPLYARVDLIRDDAGRLRLMELELIEPYLYLEHSKVEAGVCEGARMLAAALKRRLA